MTSRTLVCALFAAVLLLCGCGGKPEPAKPVATADTAAAFAPADATRIPALPPLIAGLATAASASAADLPIISWSFHAGAKLEPCGCVAGMHGGLARRATLLGRVPRERALHLEGGGWSGGLADYQLVRTRLYLEGLTLAGIAGLGLGTLDIGLGQARLAAVLSGPHPPLLSAHVTVAPQLVGSASAPRLLPSLRLTAGGRSVVLTAVASPTARGDGLIVEDPVEGLLRVVRSAAGAHVVCLADLDSAACIELARAVPGLSVVLGGQVKDPSPAPIAVGAARVLWCANEGKTLGWWPWEARSAAFELIRDGIPDHPQQRALITRYQDAIGALDLSVDERIAGLTQLSGAQPGSATSSYIGDAACAACHVNADTVHRASRHAHALDALRSKGYLHDPDCLRCHVTGLGLPDGYHRRSGGTTRPHTALVSCESCHGRGARHAAEMADGLPSSGSLVPVTPATCVRCHDGENSPNFTYDAYWEKIRHGR